MKAAGLSVAVIVLIGLGGRRYAPLHERDTVSLLNSLPLEAGDLVFFNELVVEPETAYPALAADSALGVLTEEEMAAQGVKLAGV